MFGKDEYDYTQHFFDIEKKFKIDAATKLREMKPILRNAKLKYTDIEAELVNSPKISIKGLHALCILHNVKITYFTSHTYYILGNCHKDSTYKNCVIICSKYDKNIYNQNIAVKLDATDVFICNSIATRIYIQNYSKPMLAMTAYTLQNLQDMCTTLSIPIYSDNGKKKVKKILYQDITEKIM